MGYFLVADDAFPLSTRLLKPYALSNLTYIQRTFNFRLSRARRAIENTYGICAARWRVLANTMKLDPEKATAVVFAVCVLHNFLIDSYQEYWQEEEEQQQEQEIQRQAEQAMNIESDQTNGSEMRDLLANYFVNEGEEEFQYAYL